MTYKPDRYFKDICCSSSESDLKDKAKQFLLFEYFQSDSFPNKQLVKLFVERFQKCIFEIRQHPRFLYGILLKDAFDSGKFPFLNFVCMKYDEDNFISPTKSWISLSSECTKCLCTKSTGSFICEQVLSFI